MPQPDAQTGLEVWGMAGCLLFLFYFLFHLLSKSEIVNMQTGELVWSSTAARQGEEQLLSPCRSISILFQRKMLLQIATLIKYSNVQLCVIVCCWTLFVFYLQC